MTLPDFGAGFALYMREWIKALSESDEGPEDEDLESYVEEHGDELYLAWLDTPAEWLDGAAPSQYFDRFADPAELLACAALYAQKSEILPDPLVETMHRRGQELLPYLYRILPDENALLPLRLIAAEILSREQAEADPSVCISLLSTQPLGGALSNWAIASLIDGGEDLWPLLQKTYDKADYPLRMGLIHALAGPPTHPDAMELACGLLAQAEYGPHISMLAQLLEGLQDENALPALMEAALRQDITYAEYKDIAIAIESLFGTPPKREFYGDAAYELLRKEPADV